MTPGNEIKLGLADLGFVGSEVSAVRRFSEADSLFIKTRDWAGFAAGTALRPEER
jgi:hypothetical protein